MSFNDDMKNIDFEGTDLEGLIMNNPLEKGLKALEEAGDLREKVSRLEKALANCASALYESNINHKSY